MTLLRRLHAEEESDEDDSERENDNVVATVPLVCDLTAQQNFGTHHSSSEMDQSLTNIRDASDSSSSEHQEASSSSEENFSDAGNADDSLSEVHDDSSSDEHSSQSGVGSSDSEQESEQLYQGSDISSDEAILKVLRVYIRERWTKTSLDANVKLIKSLLPRPNSFPTSGKKLLSKLNDLSALQVEKEHYYCSKCQAKKEKETDMCENCMDCECKDKEEDVRKNCSCQKTGIFLSFVLKPN